MCARAALNCVVQRSAHKSSKVGGGSGLVHSPAPKRLSTTSPAARKGLFLGMGSLVPLDVLHTPNMREQCKLICTRGDGRSFALADLNRLLQYLHGRVLGFCCRLSAASSAVIDGAGASIDCSGSMA